MQIIKNRLNHLRGKKPIYAQRRKQDAWKLKEYCQSHKVTL